MAGAVGMVRDRVQAPIAPTPEALRDGYFTGTARALLGAIRYSDHRFRAGPLTLLRFGTPRLEDSSWVFPIEGGLLARRPAGDLRVGWSEDRLYSSLEGYRPRLPGPIYRLTQLPFHHQISRIALLHIRGRLPGRGLPAEPWRRLLAGALDIAGACSIAYVVPGRLRPGTRTLLGVAALVATQTLVPALTGGVTPAGRVVGARITGVDGGRVQLLQLLVRVAALPFGLRTLRDRHDEVAGTDVILWRAARLPETEAADRTALVR